MCEIVGKGSHKSGNLSRVRLGKHPRVRFGCKLAHIGLELHEQEGAMRKFTISLLVLVLTPAMLVSAQNIKDRNAAKLRSDINPPVHRQSSVSTPPLHIRRPSPSSTHPVSVDKQLSVMEKQTQKILATPASRTKAAAAPTFKLKPEAKTKGFDASPYIRTQKPLTVTNPTGQNYGSHGSRGPTVRPPGR